MIGDFYFFLVTYFYLFININAYDVKETTIVFRLDSNGQLINTETYDDKNIEEVMNLKKINIFSNIEHQLFLVQNGM